MSTEGQLVIELRKPDWANDADGIVSGLLAEPPSGIHVDAADAFVPSTEQAQLLLFIKQFAAANEIAVTLGGITDDLLAGLSRIGLASVFSADEGDATP